jgi:hypothetical protein
MGYTEVFCMIAYRQKYYKSFASKIISLWKRITCHCISAGEKALVGDGQRQPFADPV